MPRGTRHVHTNHVTLARGIKFWLPYYDSNFSSATAKRSTPSYIPYYPVTRKLRRDENGVPIDWNEPYEAQAPVPEPTVVGPLDRYLVPQPVVQQPPNLELEVPIHELPGYNDPWKYHKADKHGVYRSTQHKKFSTDTNYGPAMPVAMQRERAIDAMLARKSRYRPRSRYYRRRYKRRYKRRYSRYGRRYLRGRGDYTTPLGAAGHAFGSWAGGKLGGMAGDFVGGMLTGVGDYTIKKNVLMSGTLPTMVNDSSGGGVVIRYQEYLTDIITSSVAGQFKIDSFLLNPGQAKTFPWLSQLAANFEEYEFEGVVFGFKSMSADALNSVNTALGTVMMCTQYDVNDPAFQTKAEMLNYEFSQAVKPSESTLHMIECARSQTVLSELYVLPDGQSVPATADPRFYHLGRFSIATQGMQGTSVNIGELHVTYQIRLLKPKLFDVLGYDVPWQWITTTGIGIIDNSNPLGGLVPTTYTYTGPIGVIVDNTADKLVFPADVTNNFYAITMQWTTNSTAAAFTNPTPSALVAAQIGTIRGQAPTTTQAGMLYFTVQCFPGAGTSEIQFSGGTMLLTGTQTLKIYITQISPSAFLAP